MFGVSQIDKVRPIVNLSYPPKASYNDAIGKNVLPKITMDSAKKISHQIYRKGAGCKISKLDHSAAYKIIPTKPSQWRLQGFTWLGRYYVDKQLVFGSKSAVPNYDSFHDIIVILALLHALGANEDDVFRILDDLISLGFNGNFIETYLKIAKDINIPLAPMGDEEKAFLYKTRGVVLGILYDTVAMTWSFPDLKIQHWQYKFQTILSKPRVTLRQLQSVSGIVNCAVTQCPMLRFWRAPIIEEINVARKSRHQKVHLKNATRQCMANWMRILDAINKGFPIPAPMGDITTFDFTFTTDASGLARDTTQSVKRGIGACGNTAFHHSILYVGQAFWPEKFIGETFDEEGKFVGCKTTFLELCGILVPLYHNRYKVRNSTVLVWVDNKPSTYAYGKGKSTKDPWATFILEVLALILIHLEIALVVKHCKRRTTRQARLADDLTRNDAKGQRRVRKYSKSGFMQFGWPPTLQKWLENPTFTSDVKWDILQDFLQVSYTYISYFFFTLPLPCSYLTKQSHTI